MTWTLRLVVGQDLIRRFRLDEECENMAREGLRTLVIGRKRLTKELFLEFQKR